jgi:hypothetical protein
VAPKEGVVPGAWAEELERPADDDAEAAEPLPAARTAGELVSSGRHHSNSAAPIPKASAMKMG